MALWAPLFCFTILYPILGHSPLLINCVLSSHPSWHRWWRFDEWKDPNRPGNPLDLDTHEGFGNGLCNCPQSFVPEEKMSWDGWLCYNGVPSCVLITSELNRNSWSRRQKVVSSSSIPLNSGLAYETIVCILMNLFEWRILSEHREGQWGRFTELSQVS